MNQAVQSLIIVARHQRDSWHALREEFKGIDAIQILLDRWNGGPRGLTKPVAWDRRANERRSLPRLEGDLHARQYVLVRPHYRRRLD